MTPHVLIVETQHSFVLIRISSANYVASRVKYLRNRKLIKVEYQNHKFERFLFGVFHYKYWFGNQSYDGWEFVLFGHGIAVGNQKYGKFKNGVKID